MPKKSTYAAHGDACATSHAMELLGDRWTYPVLRELMLSPKRFAELQSALLGLTPAVLTTRLRDLEAVGLVRRVPLPPPANVTVYESTPWAQELRPAFEALARWAVRSPVRDLSGCGLTPDGSVQSMLSMAPQIAMDVPLEVELRLFDARTDRRDTPYVFALHWADELTIIRGDANGASAVVTGDSSTWSSVLYEGADLGAMEVTGDRATVERLVAAFDGAIPAPISRP